MNPSAVNLFHQSEAARKRGDLKTTTQLLRSSIALDPDIATTWYNLGVDHANVGKREAAVAALRRVLELKPGDPYALTSLGWNLQVLGRHEEARSVLDYAVKAAPDLPLGWSKLSMALSSLRHSHAAIECARKAVALAPEDPQHHMALAFALMFDGQWAEGLREYEWRFPYRLHELGQFPIPKWDGSRVDTLFVPAEQGAGDTIQFARFIPLAAERVGRVIVAVQPELRRAILAICNNVEYVVMPAEVPVTDAYCPMMSLPVALGLSDAEIPAVQPLPPYYPDDTVLLTKGRKRVAIVWAGSSEQENDHNRSSTVEDFLRLYEASGIQLYSLQVGDRARECRPYDPLVIDLSRRIRDFADTAALISRMDAVVTVCTSVAHLAGSLGVPTHIVLPRSGQHFVWGYPTEGDTTPWYPSARLYRQERMGEWGPVLSRVAEAL